VQYAPPDSCLLCDITKDVKSWPDYSAFPESVWKVATVNGKIYGIPSVASTRVLVYRNDLLQQAGLSVPKTWQDLRTAAKAMTKDTNGDGKIDVYGFAFCSSSKAVRGPQEFAVFLNSIDHAELAVNKNGKWVPGFTPEQAEKVFQLYYDLMYVDKSVPPYSIGWEWEDLDPSFATGSVAMVQDGAWMQQRIQGGYKPETWKTASFPYCTTPSTYMEVKVEGVGKFTKHAKETVSFLKWLYGRDTMVAVTQTDNLPSRSDAVKSPLWVPDANWKDMFLANVQYGFTFPSIPLGKVFQSTMNYTQEVLYKRMTPQAAAQGFYADTKNYLDAEVN
jgi:multiple sugar transport system substrate-binding protein